jgi:DNA-binding IclR family transcriptional regulator
MIPEERILEFAGASLQSVWALEMLLMLHRDPARSWCADELIRDLRSSEVSVRESLQNLISAGLVVEDEKGYRYQPGSTAMDELVGELASLYAAKPVAVVRAIVATPNRKLQILSDAFRIKDKE